MVAALFSLQKQMRRSPAWVPTGILPVILAFVPGGLVNWASTKLIATRSAQVGGEAARGDRHGVTGVDGLGTTGQRRVPRLLVGRGRVMHDIARPRLCRCIADRDRHVGSLVRA